MCPDPSMGDRLPEATPTVAIKLASLAVHAKEALSPGGHDYDRVAIEGILQDPEVRDYLAALDALSLLPKKRGEPSHG